MANASAEMKAKADIFHALHQAPGAFIIPNPWDRGTAHPGASGFQGVGDHQHGLCLFHRPAG
jgi:2-methylisocitrate lyase-like PEP mutase family enzyme